MNPKPNLFKEKVFHAVYGTWGQCNLIGTSCERGIENDTIRKLWQPGTQVET